ncbi:MAG: PEGA domain-containing protein [Candidatus Saccharibacteria bacterium]|nr:PEGA domain-containing protein [Candidatus Saccharibacteria bacterium]
MDRERKHRVRLIKIAIIDFVSVISVVTIVLVLLGLVAGWRFNSDFKLEQNGLVQINSLPTGATVIIDDEQVFGTTNLSRILSGGEHKIVLQREGYESWEKTIKITPGWLLNLNQPHLFKQNREREELKEFDRLTFFEATRDRKGIIYKTDDKPTLHYVTDLGGDIKDTELNLEHILKEETDKDTVATDEEEKFIPFTIAASFWNKDSNRVLFKLKSGDWLYVNPKTPKESVNLSQDIKNYANYESLIKNLKSKSIKYVAFANHGGSELYLTIGQTIFKVNPGDKTISATPLVGISEFMAYDSTIVALTEPDEKGIRFVELYKDGERNVTNFYEITDKSASAHVALSEFYGQRYIIFTVGKRLFVYRNESFNQNMNKVTENDLSIVPESIAISSSGEFFVMKSGTKLAVYDSEIEDYTEYDSGEEKTRWLDAFVMFGVKNKTLSVWDHDGSNKRTLVVDDAAPNQNALITSEFKYFYYIAQNKEGKLILRRERL